MVGWIYKEDHYTLLHTKYESSGPYRFGEEYFLCFFPIVSLWELMTHWGRDIFDPRGMVGRIYKEDHYKLLNTKYESSGPCGFGEEDFFYVFPIVGLWKIITPGAGPFLTPWLAGFIKRTTIQCFIQNSKALSLVVSKKEIFYVFPIVSLWELMAPGVGQFFTPGAWLAGFIKRTATHGYI